MAVIQVVNARRIRFEPHGHRVLGAVRGITLGLQVARLPIKPQAAAAHAILHHGRMERAPVNPLAAFVLNHVALVLVEAVVEREPAFGIRSLRGRSRNEEDQQVSLHDERP